MVAESPDLGSAARLLGSLLQGRRADAGAPPRAHAQVCALWRQSSRSSLIITPTTVQAATSWARLPSSDKRWWDQHHSLVIGETVRPLDKGRFARERQGRSSSTMSFVNKPPSLPPSLPPR